MSLRIDPEVIEQVREIFKRLESPVTLNLFLAKESRCPYCKETEELISIVSQTSDKINVRKYYEGSDEAKAFNIDKYPAIVVHGKEKYNIRYFGIPVGYEFGVLIEDILHASRGKPDLPDDIVEKLKEIDKPVHIQVFMTPTCPYCPYAARVAHMFAIVNKNIVADVIEAMEFPELAEKYSVRAVPKIVINDKVSFEGAMPEREFLEKVLEAL